MRTATRAMVILCVVCSVVSAQAQAADKAEPTRSPAKPALIIDRGHTALLVMDYQNDIVAMVPEAERTPLLDKAGEVIKAARHAHLPIIYVVVRFRDGYPEVSRQNKLIDRSNATCDELARSCETMEPWKRSTVAC